VVARETFLPGGVLTRVASSHIRVGTFQFFAARRDTEALRLLADHVIARHYPEVAGAEKPDRALLEAVAARQAELIAQWLNLGFIHGVMNTDNMAVSGETIDYGPCAFMDHYHPAQKFSSIDDQGRYAYANQPRIGQWNLTRLAEAMLPLFGEDEEAAVKDAEAALETFAPRFDRAYRSGLRRKIGLSEEREEDVALIQDLLQAMTENQADFTLTFRRLADAVEPGNDEPVRSLFVDPTAFDRWAQRWRERLGQEPRNRAEIRNAMRAVNPAFIPRNHRIEAVIVAAVERQDFGPFEELLSVVLKPYEDQPEFAHYADPPQAHERVLATFCGT
jgi:uncharacterized protein YdiU (UPF0061 family)